MKKTDHRLVQLHLKNTQNRQLVLDFLDNSIAPVTPEDIFFSIKDISKCSLSTVYRILGLFCEHGIVLKNTSTDGKSYYQINSHSHSHNLVCKDCNSIVHLSDCPMEEIEDSISKETKYKIISHSLEFVGICPDCQKKKKEM